jgi:hypothetical protein
MAVMRPGLTFFLVSIGLARWKWYGTVLYCKVVNEGSCVLVPERALAAVASGYFLATRVQRRTVDRCYPYAYSHLK